MVNTGKFRARRNWFGKLVMQMEFSRTYTDASGKLQTENYWRDCTDRDILMHRGISITFKIK